MSHNIILDVAVHWTNLGSGFSFLEVVLSSEQRASYFSLLQQYEASLAELRELESTVEGERGQLTEIQDRIDQSRAQVPPPLLGKTVKIVS